MKNITSLLLVSVVAVSAQTRDYPKTPKDEPVHPGNASGQFRPDVTGGDPERWSGQSSHYRKAGFTDKNELNGPLLQTGINF